MSLIKVRESKEPVKSHKKGSVTTSHAKNAYIRTKEQGQRAMDDSENSPSEYASDNAQYMIEDAIQDAGHAVGAGTKAAIHKGQEAYQKHSQRTGHGGADPASPSGDMPHSDAPHSEVPTHYALPSTDRSMVQTATHEYSPMQSREALEKAKVSYQAKQWITKKEHVSRALQTERNAVATATKNQADLVHTADALPGSSGQRQAGITVRSEYRVSQRGAARVVPKGKRPDLIAVRKTAHAPINAHGASQLTEKTHKPPPRRRSKPLKHLIRQPERQHRRSKGICTESCGRSKGYRQVPSIQCKCCHRRR